MTEPARAFEGRDLRVVPARTLPARPLGPHPLPDGPASRAPGRTGAARTPDRPATLGVIPPLTATRTAAATRRPIHVVVAVGMTAGLYALSLAGVSTLQSAANTQLAADSAPAEGALAGLKRAHDTIEHSLTALAGTYAKAAGRYQAVADGIAGNEQALASLQAQVKAAAGSAGALSVPSLSRLPAVSSSAVTGSSRPVVNACTTASGKPC